MSAGLAPEPGALDALLCEPGLLLPVPKAAFWRITARYLLEPGERARPGISPEWEALALPLPSHRLSGTPSRRGAVDLECEPAYLSSDELTARAEFFARGQATRYKVWKVELSLASCLDAANPGVLERLDRSGIRLTQDHATWVPLLRAAWSKEIEAIRFRSYVAEARGGLNYAILKLLPGALVGAPQLIAAAG